MVLDSFLQGESILDELVRDSVTSALPNEELFTTASGIIPFSDDYQLGIPVNSESDITNALMELAFRYVAKVLVAVFCNDEGYDPIENSVAQRSIESLKWRLNGKYYNELKERYDYAVMKIFDYMENGSDGSNSLVQQCWFLAKMDICYRRGAVPSDISQFFQPATDEESQELLELALKFRRNFIPKIITPTSRVIFNPSFDFGEELIGETDCDMIVDSKIVDLRTSIGFEYPKDRVTKSMVHFLLSELNNEFGCEAGVYPVDSLVFYSARYGETEIFHIDDINPEIIDKALEKLIIVTEARHKGAPAVDNFSVKYEEGQKKKGQKKREMQERFLDDEDDRDNYNDGYYQVMERKNRHIFRKILIFLIIASLLTVGFVYLKNWYTDTYGAEYSLEQIFKNLFGN